jgi:hypothetical protein
MTDTTTQSLIAWLTQCQDEDATFLNEPSTLSRQPVRGRGGKPTGEYLPTGAESVEMMTKLYGEAEMARAKTAKRNEPAEVGPDNDLNRKQQAAARSILGPLDALAHEMEQKWGIGRLQLLVPPEWAEKYHSAFTKLNLAIDSGNLVEIRERAEVMMRGWRKLDELALAAGHQPGYDPKVWEVRGASGRVYAICQTEIDERNRSCDPDVRIITLEEVARIIDAWDADGFVTELRAQFPGSQITKVGLIHPDDRPDVGI